MYRIGYLYQQFYSITQEDGSARTGYTNHAVLHKLNDAGDIVRTYDYKCTRDFAEMSSRKEEFFFMGFCANV